MHDHTRVELKTEDNVTIIGDLYEGNEIGIILLHMYTTTRHIWNEFAQELHARGYTVFSLDFRGHGESALNYKKFSEEDFNKMIFDVKAAHHFLGKEKTVVIGASIGANIALKYASHVDGVVALSPSFNYKGIRTEDDAKKITVPVLLISSEEDIQSFNDIRKLHYLIKGSGLKTCSGKGHGTRMLDSETKMLIFGWLDSYENL
mgnify:FL=1